MAPPADHVFATPVFEGSEKRISVSFAPSNASHAPIPPPTGLRSLPRASIDTLLDKASCQVVSAKFSQYFDAYVLSESSLFVYPDRFVLKTCGTTKLLDCLPCMIELAAGLGLKPARVKYSRASFLFPDLQPEPHHGFEFECQKLQSLFGDLGATSAVVMGDAMAGLQWHIFVAGGDPSADIDDETAIQARLRTMITDHCTQNEDKQNSVLMSKDGATNKEKPIHTIEVCMTGLSAAKAAQFVRDENFESAKAVTETSGIQKLVGNHRIDDYVFEPCGYSMNGIGQGENANEFSTVHITPEDQFSYASFELCGYDPVKVLANDLVSDIASAFQPKRISVAISVDTLAPGPSVPGWGAPFVAPTVYACHSASYQEIRCGGYVAYFTLERINSIKSAWSTKNIAGADMKSVPQKNGGQSDDDVSFSSSQGVSTPRGVLKHFPSFSTLSASRSSIILSNNSYGLNQDGFGIKDESKKLKSTSVELSKAEMQSENNLSDRMEGTNFSENSSDSTSLTMHGEYEHQLENDQGEKKKSIGTNAFSSPDGPSSPSSMSLERFANMTALNYGTVPPSFYDVLADYGAVPLPSGDVESIDAHIKELIRTHEMEDNFYVVDLGAAHRLWSAWESAMPRVHPHYAVKCNNDPALLRALASLGAGFDCASEAEVEQIISLGVSPDRIVFANPCKRPADIRAAVRHQVMLSTFDTEAELIKLARWAPRSRVLLRIRADDPTARCQLGNKFGAEEWEWSELFAAARQLGIGVDGVSFHVGSGATNPAAFSYAIEAAKRAFDLGTSYGFDMSLLDIGGGFCGGRFGPDGKVDLGGVPAAVNSALAAYFPETSGVRIIAEPGRFFSEVVATLATLVYGRRQRAKSADSNEDNVSYDYWVTDGLYGSMNCLLYDHATISPRPLIMSYSAKTENNGNTTMFGATKDECPSTVFGPTCDGLDTIVRNCPLPTLHVGDWLTWPRMGAYTLCGASKFNGMNAVDVPTFYVCSEKP